MAGFRIYQQLKPADIITGLYILVTGLIMIFLSDTFDKIMLPVFIRLIIILMVSGILCLRSRYTSGILKFIHQIYPILLLSYLYGETALINQIIFTKSFDHIIFHWEELLFGFQPSLEFSILFPQKWFSELLHFGYFSYYFLTFGVCLVFFIKRPEISEKVISFIVTSFFLYYLIFIIFPVIGPQYFFPKPMSDIPDSGIFSKAVKLVQFYGEKPTGAFPSSHVGMAAIYLYLSFRYIRNLFFIILPFFILILFATVYLKAHYAIDVIAGLISAPIIYFVSISIYNLMVYYKRNLPN